MLNNIGNNDIELRKLSPAVIFGLTQILECGEAWKQLMAIIPMECKDGNPPKYTVEHMKLVESAGAIQKRSCSEILLDEWGTSGRQRPYVTNLLHCLVKANLYRAAEYVAVKILKVDPPTRPMNGPAAPIDIQDCLTSPTVLPIPCFESPRPCNQRLVSEHESMSAVTQHSQGVIQNSSVQLQLQRTQSGVSELCYSVLSLGTQNFNNEFKIGGGAWGTVYVGTLPAPLGHVAIKRLHSTGVPGDPAVQFRSEVETLSQLSHSNLLLLLGFSVDGPSLCLVYEFMQNGSLQDRLATEDSSLYMPWKTRWDIAIGTGQGLSHLHNALDRPLVHRDVKSANILLDNNLTPKLGDFGLVRFGSSGSRSHSFAMTTTVFGTSAYMAPEAFRGDVSVKMDVFSFGVVLLELLTGLPPYDQDREGWDIVSHVKDADDINDLLDAKAGTWNANTVDTLYHLILDCVCIEKKKRPNINMVLDRLMSLPS